MKTVRMQAEWPCRNGAFEESVNAPFRAGGIPEITTTDSETFVAKMRGFGLFSPPLLLPLCKGLLVAYFLVTLVAFGA